MMNNNLVVLPDYQISKIIYDGVRTLVYRGTSHTNNQNVIIKVLRNEYPTFNELLGFRNQYAIAHNLAHPNIIHPLALERYGNGYALIMADVGAISLSDYWFQSKRSVKEFCHQAIQLTEALHYLIQQRIIHKDIKPANILIHPETQHVTLIDFSISSLLPKEQQQLVSPNILEGTLAYISPEQTGRMNRGIDYRTDFYSLGVTFYELLTGRLPFQSNDPMELVHCHIAKQVEFPSQSEIPQVLQEIVLKLMAKNAEERYQSALGLKHDLERCLQLWESSGAIPDFKLGERDICDRFIIPEKLYGREVEVAQLLAAFERVANPPMSPLTKGGFRGVEMMLVAGFSGIGKTAVVNEVHKPIVRQRGYFIKGKFDQFNRNIPFSAFVQAFRSLMGQLLSESDAELTDWKTKILEAVGNNAQVLIEVIPELEAVIGKQPAVPELSGSAAQNRFNLLFEKFIAVFTTPDHPLVMFLDDLQWADSASLNLVKVLMADNQTGYLLLLGAYRDNEVFPAHPLMLTLDELAKLEAAISTITLAPLSLSHINQLVAETLTCNVEQSQPLTELVYQKTKGNPFFTTQFLVGLYEDELITFNPNLGYWECDLVKIRDAALTSDVVEFMARRLQKLPAATQEVLKLAACIGNQFDLETLAIVRERVSEEVAIALWSALQEGMILPISEAYKFFQGEINAAVAETVTVNYRFLHDRVQQAAYSLIPDEQKETTHYHIGQLLLQQISSENREERIFELVGQLNYGTSLITDRKERDELAKLNLIACRKARASTAYQAGRDYANTGLALLGATAWTHQYEMTLEFHNLVAEFALLCGDFEAMEQFIETVIARAGSFLEQVKVYRIRIQAHVSQNKLAEAIAIAQQILQQLGIAFPEIPTEKDMQQAFAGLSQLIGDREIEDLVHLPVMTEVEKIAIVQIANSIMPATNISGSPLFPLVVSLSVKLSIEYGNTSASVMAYACYGIIVCNMQQNANTGVKFGQLALQVVSKLDAKAVKPEVLSVAGLFIFHRKSHLKETLQLSQEGYKTALEVGNLEFAGRNTYVFCLNSFWCGQSLTTLEPEIRAYCNALVQLNQLTPANYCRISWQSILNLLSAGEHQSLLSGEAFQEAEILPRLLEAHDLFGLYLFYLYKMVLCYLFEELESAQNYASEVRCSFAGGAGTIGEPIFYFYDSLNALATLSPRSPQTSDAFQQVEQNQTKLQQQWANHAPMNHQHKVDLVEAEKCRVLGQKVEAIEFYDKAIAGAKENEYIQEEALANELFAKFYRTWGREKEASVYMQEAYYCYAQWGAKAKTDDLEQRYPELLKPILQRDRPSLSSKVSISNISTNSHTQTATVANISSILDFSSLLKASQTLSGEIELDRLLSTLMKIILENAGATKGALLLSGENGLTVEAIASRTDTKNDLTLDLLHQSIPLAEYQELPSGLINYVRRTTTALLDAKTAQTQFAADKYLLRFSPQSLLCLPLLERGNLIGILYLENTLTADAFTDDRIELLDALCAQAAISLSNARLYQKAQQALQDLQDAQLQLVQNEKMATLGNLVAGVAHEINNPVGFIEGNITAAQEYIQDLLEALSLYAENTTPPESVVEELEDLELEFMAEDFPKLIASMQEGVNRIRNISTSLRTFSRTDTATKTEFSLGEGLDSTLLILKYRLKANECRPAIKVVKSYGNVPPIKCYAGQLNQVFMNLLANAIDAFEEDNQGKTYQEIEKNINVITICTSLEKHQVQIKIQDNGCGMKPETKERIFEQGFTTKGVGKGTGLGMAIAHQIIAEKHGGTISCLSELGKGTTFIITIPLL